MAENRTSISKARSYREIGEFWGTHDLSKYWNRLRPVKFEVEIESETTYYPLDSSLSTALRSIARKRGISPEILLNLWVQEKVQEVRK